MRNDCHDYQDEKCRCFAVVFDRNTSSYREKRYNNYSNIHIHSNNLLRKN